MMAMTVFAVGSGSIAVDSKTAQSGQTVSVDVSITGNPGVAALVIVPEYDSSVLTLDSITGSGLQWTIGKAASWSDAANYDEELVSFSVAAGTVIAVAYDKKKRM